MSLLSTFAILFETDAKEAADETEKLSETLGDVEGSAESATKATDGATAAYGKNTQSIGGLTRAMFGMIAAYVTFDTIASGIIDNAAQIDTVGKFSQTLGLNIVQLDAWGEAAARNGGSAEAFRGSVESLQSSLQEMEITGGGEMINTLAMLGIQATDSSGKVKEAFDILPELAEVFERMSAQQSFAFGKKLGLDQGTILMLQQSRHEVEKLVERQKMLGGVTEDGYEAAAKFNDQWDDTKRVFNSLWMSANGTILPVLQSILGGLESVVLWVRENQTLVEGFFIGVAGAVTIAYLPAIASAAAATVALLAPFIAIGAAIAAVGAAFAVAYEDVAAWVNGSKSAIGTLLGPFEDFKNKVMGVFDSISERWRRFIQFFIDTKNGIVDFFGSDDGEVSAANITANSAKAQAMIGYYSATNLNQGGSLMNQRTQNVNVNVGGAQIDARGMTPQQAAQAFSGGIKQNVEMAIGQLADGVAR